jgi:hypothetical protein
MAVQGYYMAVQGCYTVDHHNDRRTSAAARAAAAPVLDRAASVAAPSCLCFPNSFFLSHFSEALFLPPAPLYDLLNKRGSSAAARAAAAPVFYL